MQPDLLALLRTLTLLRGYAAVGQAAAIVLAGRVLSLPLLSQPLWIGVATLAIGTLVAAWQTARFSRAGVSSVLAWLTLDIAVLTWQLWWSGGMTNPFVSLYLVPIALAAVALPRAWTVVCLLLCAACYLLLAFTAPALPHAHDPAEQTALLDLHLWGMAVNFLLTALLFVGLLTRLVSTLRQRDSELAQLREQQTRNEGIVALGTQAAAMAHELNTPLGTLKLLGEELRESNSSPPTALLDSMDEVIDHCRDRIRALVASTDPAQQAPVELDRWLQHALDRWKLTNPQVQLEARLAIVHAPSLVPDARLTHLLHALLDNAAQASRANGSAQVRLCAETPDSTSMRLQIIDAGPGMSASGKLYGTTKPDGLGLGLALSQATIEWLGGSLRLHAQPGGGTRTEAVVPLQRLLADP